MAYLKLFHFLNIIAREKLKSTIQVCMPVECQLSSSSIVNVGSIIVHKVSMI